MPEEMKMDKTIVLARNIANRINAFPHNGLLKRVDYQLVANTEDMYDFILQVENLADELAEMKAIYISQNCPIQINYSLILEVV